jgi:hypothetical protein
MEEERSIATRALSIFGFGLLAFAITILMGGIWSALLVANLRSSPAVPWSVPVMAFLLWLMWNYLGGKGWPRSTSDARRRYLRANRRSARTYLWAFVAGVLSVIALAGYWIVLFRLVKMPPNALPDMSAYPRITVALMIVMGSLVSPFMEEAGCGRRVWHDGVSHQLDASGPSPPRDRRPDIFHLGVAARCCATTGFGQWDRQLVLDTRCAGDRIYGAGSLGVSAARPRE